MTALRVFVAGGLTFAPDDEPSRRNHAEPVGARGSRARDMAGGEGLRDRRPRRDLASQGPSARVLAPVRVVEARREQIYFIAIVYSFALHLRRGSYASLPLSKPPSAIATSGNRRRNSYAYSHLRDMSNSTGFGDDGTGH